MLSSRSTSAHRLTKIRQHGALSEAHRGLAICLFLHSTLTVCVTGAAISTSQCRQRVSETPHAATDRRQNRHVGGGVSGHGRARAAAPLRRAERASGAKRSALTPRNLAVQARRMRPVMPSSTKIAAARHIRRDNGAGARRGFDQAAGNPSPPARRASRQCARQPKLGCHADDRRGARQNPRQWRSHRATRWRDCSGSMSPAIHNSASGMAARTVLNASTATSTPFERMDG